MRRSSSDRWGGVILAAVVFAGAATVILAGIAVAATSAIAALFLLAVGALLLVPTAVMANEALARWRTGVTLDTDAVELRLPARRGMVKLEPVAETVPLEAVEAVETRLEAFHSAGSTVLQRAYALRLSGPRRIVLGADRRLIAPFYAGVASAIASRAGAPILDLGAVDGEVGFLMLRGHAVPEWDAASLAVSAADVRLRQESRTWQILSIVLLICALLVLLASLL
jgi:hypothetical protein